MKQFTPYAFKRLLESYGMQGHIDPVVSMCMGTPDISVRELVGAYTAFANKGIRVEPLIVTHIEDGYGNTIATFSPRIHEVLSEEASFKMLDMLQGVIDGGTGGRVRRIYNIKAPMGGKTGTTQNNSDGWFIGFTPDLAAGAWVGGEERSVHFDRTADGQGASMALPIYGEFFKRVFADKELGYSDTTKFVIPEQYADPCSSSRGHISTQPNEPSHIDDIFN
ncbi:MAG: penicillin-binding transpeptidase domain-containing protein, partial [Tannerellaceae bacterium]